MKKCRSCKSEFESRNSLDRYCKWQCALTDVRDKRIKKEKKEFHAETRRRKQEMKTRSDWLREAQTEVNKYVRIRDRGKLCISCGKPDNGQHQRHASHYQSTASNSALRFNLRNIHASCMQCNTHLSGNIGEYTPRLIKKIGQEKYDWLLTQNHTVKYEIEYLQRLKKVFAKRSRIKDRRLK